MYVSAGAVCMSKVQWVHEHAWTQEHVEVLSKLPVGCPHKAAHVAAAVGAPCMW